MNLHIKTKAVENKFLSCFFLFEYLLNLSIKLSYYTSYLMIYEILFD